MMYNDNDGGEETMSKEEVFKEYEKALARIDKQAHEAREEARATLQGQLKAIRDELHEELKTVRVISQKTRRSK